MEANTPTAPAGHLLAAPRWCAACGHGIAADKGNSLVRHARTAHRAGAHYAWLTLKEGGKNSHRLCGNAAQTPPSGREASYKITRASRVSLRQRPTFAHTCAYGERVSRRVLYCCHTAAARENTLSGIYAVQWVVSQYHDFFFHQFERKSVNYTSCTIGRIIGDCLVFLKR